MWVAACAGEPDAIDPGFSVVAVSPADGATDVVEAHVPELRFSGPIDTEACGPEELRLDGVQADLSVAFPVEGELVLLDGGVKVQLHHDNPLPRGWLYAITVRGGLEGCRALSGETVHPFGSTFEVP